MKDSPLGRVLLDADAMESVTQMMTTLRKEGGHLKVNASKLTSWVMKYFHTHCFEKTKKEIASEFFNKRAFLRELISSPKSDEEILASINRSLGKRKQTPASVRSVVVSNGGGQKPGKERTDKTLVDRDKKLPLDRDLIGDFHS